MKTRIVLFFLVLSFSLAVQAANPTCGVTIITHGFLVGEPIGHGAFPEWARKMALAITDQIGSSIPIYRVRYDKRGTLLQTDDQIVFEDGDIDISNGAIILLDWVGISNDELLYDTENVASVFFDYLFSSTEHTNGHFLFEVPLHFIGHSRGASLNNALIYALATHGILIDHVTTLDPHPSTFSTANDWPMRNYQNVIFADNYWRTGLVPQGEAVSGSFNVNLDAEFDGAGDPQSSQGLFQDLFVTEHQAVHTYYYGTMDTTIGSDGDISILTTPWFTVEGISRDITGFAFSRYAHRVNRDSTGISQYFFGTGGTGSRVSVALTSPLWPNAGFDQRSAIPSRANVGQTIAIPFYGAHWGSPQTITFSLDADTNPFNGIEHDIGSMNQNASLSGTVGMASFPWTLTVADVGTHFIRVKASDSSGGGRYDYFLRPITVEGGKTGDTTRPTISAFAVTPSAVTLGSGFSISFTVSDAGGSGLKRVELWRADVNGLDNDLSWKRIGDPMAAFGNGPFSSAFFDIPATAGNYWYGMHVLDDAAPLANLMNERIAGVGPKQVTVNPPQPSRVQTPVISPASGNFDSAVTISITCATDGAVVYYTLDGTEPTQNTLRYNSPFVLPSTGVVQARAFKTNYDASSVASSTFIISTISANNDRFENRAALTGLLGRATGSTVGATWEFEVFGRKEPKVQGAIPFKSVWWTWTAPTSGGVHFVPSWNSENRYLIAGIYTGAALSSLTEIAGSNPTGDAIVRFRVTSGTAYEIQVGELFPEPSGEFILFWELTPDPTLPIMTLQPLDQTVTPGATVIFAVSATSIPAPTYQWKFNGNDIPGSTNPTLTLNNVQSANAGSYAVVVSNAAGSVSSSSATLTVNMVVTPSDGTVVAWGDNTLW